MLCCTTKLTFLEGQWSFFILFMHAVKKCYWINWLYTGSMLDCTNTKMSPDRKKHPAQTGTQAPTNNWEITWQTHWHRAEEQTGNSEDRLPKEAGGPLQGRLGWCRQEEEWSEEGTQSLLLQLANYFLKSTRARVETKLERNAGSECSRA